MYRSLRRCGSKRSRMASMCLLYWHFCGIESVFGNSSLPSRPDCLLEKSSVQTSVQTSIQPSVQWAFRRIFVVGCPFSFENERTRMAVNWLSYKDIRDVERKIERTRSSENTKSSKKRISNDKIRAYKNSSQIHIYQEFTESIRRNRAYKIWKSSVQTSAQMSHPINNDKNI